MAKPRVVKLKGAEQATLIYMSEAKADEYESVLLNYISGKEAAIESNSPLESQAFSLVQNPETKKWELVTISFSALTKSCKIDSIKEVAVLRKNGVDALKVALIKAGLV